MNRKDKLANYFQKIKSFIEENKLILFSSALFLTFLAAFLFKSTTLNILLPNEFLGPDPYRAYRWFLETLYKGWPFPDCYSYFPMCLPASSFPFHFLYPFILYYLSPLTLLFKQLLLALGATNVQFYSYTNLVALLSAPFMFLLATILYYWVLKEVFGLGEYALIFAILPALHFRDMAGRVEKEPISTLLFLAILATYVYGIKTNKKVYRWLSFALTGLLSAILILTWGGFKLWIAFIGVLEVLRWLTFGPIVELIAFPIAFYLFAVLFSLIFGIDVSSLLFGWYAPFSYIPLFLGILNVLPVEKIEKVVTQKVKMDSYFIRLGLIALTSIIFVPYLLSKIFVSRVLFTDRFITSVAEYQHTVPADWVRQIGTVGLALMGVGFILSSFDWVESLLAILFYIATVKVFPIKLVFLLYLLWVGYVINKYREKLDLPKIFLLASGLLLISGSILVRLIFTAAFMVPILLAYSAKRLEKFVENYDWLKKYKNHIILGLMAISLLSFYAGTQGFGLLISLYSNHLTIAFYAIIFAFIALVLFVLVKPSISSAFLALSALLTGWLFQPLITRGDWKWLGLKEIFDRLPKDSLITHWWDYGYLTQFFANNWTKNKKDWTFRVTFMDGGNYYPYWNHLFGRYVLGAFNETSALELLFAHANFNETIKEKVREWFNYTPKANYNGTLPTFLYIDDSDIYKSYQFTRLGSNENYDIQTMVVPFETVTIKGNALEISLDFPNDDPKVGPKCVQDINKNLYCLHAYRVVIYFDKNLYSKNVTLYNLKTLPNYQNGPNLFIEVNEKTGAAVVAKPENFTVAKPIKGEVYFVYVEPSPDGTHIISKPAKELPLRCVYVWNHKYILNESGYGCVYFAPSIKVPLNESWYLGGFFMNYAEKMLWGKLYFFDEGKHFKTIFLYAPQLTPQGIVNVAPELLKLNKHGITLEIQPSKLFEVIYPENFSIPDWKRCLYLARNAQEALKCVEIFHIPLPKDKLELLKQGNYYVI